MEVRFYVEDVGLSILLDEIPGEECPDGAHITIWPHRGVTLYRGARVQPDYEIDAAQLVDALKEVIPVYGRKL